MKMIQNYWVNDLHLKIARKGRSVKHLGVLPGPWICFTGQRGSVNPSIAQHDWLHLLCDYNTTIEGELGLFIHWLSNSRHQRLSFLVAIVSLFETGRLESWGGGVLNTDKGHLDLPDA